MLELLIVVLVILWLFGYFGRGRVYSRGGGGDGGAWFGGNVVHTLLVIAVILIILRVLRLL